MKHGGWGYALRSISVRYLKDNKGKQMQQFLDDLKRSNIRVTGFREKSEDSTKGI